MILVMEDNLKFKHPFTSIISGPTGPANRPFAYGYYKNSSRCAPNMSSMVAYFGITVKGLLFPIEN